MQSKARNPLPAADAGNAPRAPAQPPAARTTPALRGGDDTTALPDAQTALGEAPQPHYDAWIGRVLDDRYRITEHLGAGGMGAVFVAEHLKLRKPVALKVIRAELAGNGEVAARFAREAMATAQFEHPHVASAIDFGTLDEGGAYLVMQLVRGESLRALLDRQGALRWPMACELLAQVADALAAARSAGIVHRDLKPENILVERRDDGSLLAKILDFGIAHVIQPAALNETDPREHALTRAGTVMGTPGYMSPEQAVGDRVDHRTDLYALGVVLWECLTGKPLWSGEDVMAIITRQLREEVPSPRESLGDPLFPRALDQLVLRLCSRMQEQRPESAALVRDELRSLARQSLRPGFALAERVSMKLTAARTKLHALPADRRALLLAGCAALLLLVAFVTLHGARTAEPEDPEGAPDTDTPVVQTAPDDQTMAARALQFAQRMVQKDARTQSTAEAKPSIPKELEADVLALSEAKRQAERRRAATKILRYKGPERLPAYLLASAKLERARNCRERGEAIAEIEELRDPRSLPALKRIADAPKSGCGIFGLSDCYACVRAPARDAIGKVTAE